MSEVVDPAVGRLVITPAVISTGGMRVDVTIVPTEDAHGWNNPGSLDQRIDGRWTEIGGFLSTHPGGMPLTRGARRGGGVYLGSDPFKDWAWDLMLSLTFVDSPVRVWVNLNLPVGLYRLRYDSFAGTVEVVDHDVPTPWSHPTDHKAVGFDAGFPYSRPSGQRRLQISVRIPAKRRLNRFGRYRRGPRRIDDHARIWTWTGDDWAYLLDAAIEPSDTIGEHGEPPHPRDDDDATVVLPPLPNGPYQVRCTYERVGELTATFMITSSYDAS